MKKIIVIMFLITLIWCQKDIKNSSETNVNISNEKVQISNEAPNNLWVKTKILNEFNQKVISDLEDFSKK